MNKLLYTITVLCISISAFAKINYNIPYVSVVPQYDGVLNAGEWDDALAVNVSYADFVTNGIGTSITATTPSAGDISGVYYFKWDETNLYMAFSVTDDLLQWRKTYPGPYNGQDAVQLCFNPYNNASAVFETGAWIFDIVAETSDTQGADIYRHTGTLNVDPNNIASTISPTNDGYVIEMVIAWDEIKPNLTATQGDIHGLGLMILDFDGSVVDSLLCDFGSGVNVIAQPAQWNTMTLVGEGGCGSQGRYAGDVNADCYVNLLDFAVLAQSWFDCTDPVNADCQL